MCETPKSSFGSVTFGFRGLSATLAGEEVVAEDGEAIAVRYSDDESVVAREDSARLVGDEAVAEDGEATAERYSDDESVAAREATEIWRKCGC